MSSLGQSELFLIDVRRYGEVSVRRGSTVCRKYFVLQSIFPNVSCVANPPFLYTHGLSSRPLPPLTKSLSIIFKVIFTALHGEYNTSRRGR